MGLQVMNLTFGANDKSCFIDLGYTKGGVRRNEKESVFTDDPWVVKLLRRQTQKKMKGDYLFAFSTVYMRKTFASLIRKVYLDPTRYKPYSLRRGGATHFFRTTGSMSQVSKRGRWGNEKTARLYVQDGLAELSLLHQSAGAKRAEDKGHDLFVRLA